MKLDFAVTMDVHSIYCTRDLVIVGLAELGDVPSVFDRSSKHLESINPRHVLTPLIRRHEDLTRFISAQSKR